jgi:hypothetical protein
MKLLLHGKKRRARCSTGLNNVLLPTLFTLVNNIEQCKFRGGSRIFRTSVKIVWQTGLYRVWAWSRLGVVDYRRGGGEWALNNFYAESPPLDF